MPCCCGLLPNWTLGERIETLLLQVLERLLEAAYTSGRDKTRALQRASQGQTPIIPSLTLSPEGVKGWGGGDSEHVFLPVMLRAVAASR